jgi:hypothetical protein
MSKASKLKLSAQVRARILFGREVEIDTNTGANLINDEIFLGLLERRQNIARQRDRIVRSIFVMIALVYALGNEWTVQIPGIQVSIENESYLTGAILCFASLGIMQMMVNFGAEQSYDSLIDQIIIKKSKNTIIDPDIIKAAYQDNFLILKVLRKNFNIYHEDTIKLRPFATFLYGAVVSSIVFVWVSFFFVVSALIVYLSLAYVEADLVGWMFRLAVWMLLCLGLVLQVVQGIEVEVEDTYSDNQPDQLAPSSDAKA